MKKWRITGLAVAFAALVAGPALAKPDAQGRCPGDKSASGAMWLSIAHPGVGEYYLKGWGPWSNMPPLKFYLGFIPGYGWPGYLQVKSAIDAANCRTNDKLSFGGDE